MSFCAVTAILMYLLPGGRDQKEAEGDSNVQNREILFSSVYSLSRVRLFATPWTAACQASLPITNCQSLLKPISIESVMPSNHLILCRPLLLLPSVFPSIRVFSNESVLRLKWPKHSGFSFQKFCYKKVKISDGRQLL